MSFDKSDAVTLIVGSERHEMLVHANQISKTSAFFKAALKKEWLETRTIHLPAETEQNITHYLRFAYSGICPDAGDAGTMSEEEHHDLEWTTLAQLYTLGKRLMDDVLQDQVIGRLIWLNITLDSDDVPSRDPIDIIYTGTLTGDPARKLLVDLYLKSGKPQSLANGADPALLLDLALAHLSKAEDRVALGVYRHKRLSASDYVGKKEVCVVSDMHLR